MDAVVPEIDIELVAPDNDNIDDAPDKVKLVPIKACWAIAIPPAVVIDPPLVALVASVAILIPIPPINLSDPVIFEVDAVVPETDIELLAPDNDSIDVVFLREIEFYPVHKLKR